MPSIVASFVSFVFGFDALEPKINGKRSAIAESVIDKENSVEMVRSAAERVELSTRGLIVAVEKMKTKWMIEHREQPKND